MKKKESLAERSPELAMEWDYEKNGDLKPEDVSVNSCKRVWWQCDQGHEWMATVAARYKGQPCPYCSKKIQLNQ